MYLRSFTFSVGCFLSCFVKEGEPILLSYKKGCLFCFFLALLHYSWFTL